MSDMIPITPDVLDKWRAEVTVGPRRHFHPDHVHALLDHIAKVEAERDALREALAPLMSWPDGTPKRWVAGDEVHPIEAEALMTVRALLNPEDGERDAH